MCTTKAASHRRYWGAVVPEVVWSRTSKTVSHEEAEFELDVLVNGEPVKGVLDKRGNMAKLCPL